MEAFGLLDVSFDVYSDTPPGADPDQKSPTLRRYHAALWSKELPCGKRFSLTTKTAGAYLHHNSELGEFILASDAITNSYRHSKLVAPVISQVPEDQLDAFFSLCSTIGGYTLFPGRKISRKPTINGARGLHPKIGDRFDLTLECIRLHYAGKVSPLSEVFNRYRNFFDLFTSFEGYVDYFLLQDLRGKRGEEIRFFLPHCGFEGSPYPTNLAAYSAYQDAVSEFVMARNHRISEFAAAR